MSQSQLEQFENIWETEMKKGNCFFQSSAYVKACPHYMQAMIASEVLMENLTGAWGHYLRVPGMYYTACINIAHNYWGMQDIKNAADYFFYCTYNLRRFADKPNKNSLLKETAMLYWQKAVTLYAAFADRTGTSISIDMNKAETYVQLEKLKELFTLRKENMN
jgi:hypothetical protein